MFRDCSEIGQAHTWPTRASALAGAREGWVAYRCDQHGSWHLQKETVMEDDDEVCVDHDEVRDERGVCPRCEHEYYLEARADQMREELQEANMERYGR